MIYINMKSFFITSTVGRKLIIGLTGLILMLFIGVHMAGNLLLFVSPKAYNLYSHALISNPATIVIEILLLMSFAFHVLWALAITVYNKQKKGVVHKRLSGHWIHKTLWVQGVIIFVFVVLHLVTFKYGTLYEVQYDEVVVRDLFRLVAEVFQKPIYVIWYLLCLVILGFHLSHGLKASIRSLGFYHDRYTPVIDKIGFFMPVWW